MSDSAILETFHHKLLHEIQEDLSEVQQFEKDQHFDPYFREYYRNFLGTDRHRRRAFNATLGRRAPLIQFVDELRSRFGPEPLVLEVGSGFGSDALFLAQLGCRVIGIDPEENKVAVAGHRSKYWQAHLGEGLLPEFHQGFVEDFDFNRDRFHGAYTAECLHHCEPVEAVLLKLREVVRDDGIVYINESNAANPVLYAWRELLYRGPRRIVVERDKNKLGLYGRENIRSPRHWRRLFGECGFTVDRTIYSRHLLSEALSLGCKHDQVINRLPGAMFFSIHVAFCLRPRALDPKHVHSRANISP